MASAGELAAEAAALFVDEDFEGALEKYSEAIRVKPSAELLSARAAVHLKLEAYPAAVQDCNAALELDSKNAKTFLRKGTACFHLEEFATALQAFEAGRSLDANNATFKTWIRKCNAELDSDDAPAPAPAAAAAAAPAPAPAAAAAAAPVSSKPKKVERFRHDWIQNPTTVTLTVYMKGSSKDNCEVAFEEQAVALDRRLEGSDSWQLNMDLWGSIVPAESQAIFMSTKVEIKMKKAKAGKWDALERPDQEWSEQAEQEALKKRQQYPSSKSHTDWDKVAKEIEENEPKAEGDEALNNFFAELYGKSSEETRRAMNKSFQESGGTVLSTNWGEVGSKKVEGSAPDGLEMKKWSDLGK